FAIGNVLINQFDGHPADLLGRRACGRQEYVEHVFLPELNPDLAAEAGGRPFVYGDRKLVADIFLAPERREVLVEIISQHGDSAIHHHTTQWVFEYAFLCLPLIEYGRWKAVFCQRQVLTLNKGGKRRSGERNRPSHGKAHFGLPPGLLPYLE